MKRLSKIMGGTLLTFVVTVSLAGSAFASGTHTENGAHVYATLPGSAEWNNMTVEQRLASCAVSKDEVVEMSTEALAETVLNYPYLINIYAYDDLGRGIEMVSRHCPGLPELFYRSDAADVLQIQAQARANNLTSYHAWTLLGAMGGNGSRSARAAVTTLYTPNGAAVEAYVDATWSDHKMTESVATQMSNACTQTYPSATILRSANPKYNCHSYAWYSTSSSNRYWINDPTPFTTDGSYYKDYRGVNNKITYRTNSGYTHSGIITSTANGLTKVSSKWGVLALFSHNHLDCPYVVDAGTSVMVEYWKRK